MEQILFGIEGVRISIDDVIVHAATMGELINRLRKVFERRRANNLRLNLSKCEFGVTQISVLGHVVDADGIKPDPKKCEAIKATPPSRNVSDFRSFLGTCGYVAKFIPNYANIVEPLRKLTRDKEKWSWKAEQTRAFEALKEALSCEPVLACFHFVTRSESRRTQTNSVHQYRTGSDRIGLTKPGSGRILLKKLICTH